MAGRHEFRNSWEIDLIYPLLPPEWHGWCGGGASVWGSLFYGTCHIALEHGLCIIALNNSEPGLAHITDCRSIRPIQNREYS